MPARQCLRVARLLLILLMAGVLAAPARADFEEALRAYNRSDFAGARREFFQAANQGHAGAQYYLGEIYEGGVGVPVDYSAAFDWYQLAAERGHARAQRRLASLYSRGLGTDRDETKAFQWYLSGAGNGDVLAQFETGLRYVLGQGAEKNAVEAYKWLTIAAVYGDPDAIEQRDRLLGDLSVADRQRAESLARDWERACESRNRARKP